MATTTAPRQHWLFINFLLLNYLLIFVSAKSHVYWYGDERAYMQPPASQGFFDLAYIEGCPQGIESSAIPKYAYFGPLIRSLFLKSHAECLLECLQNRRCMAVNYFDALPSQTEGYCELLSENQLDNPRKMRPFAHTTYYDKIKCPKDIIDQLNENYDFNLLQPYDPPIALKKPKRLLKRKHSKKSLKKLLNLNMDYRHRS